MEQPKRQRLTPWDITIYALSTLYCGLIMFFARTLYETTTRFAILTLALSIVLYSFMDIREKGMYRLAGWRLDAYCVLLALIGVVTGLYFYTQFYTLYTTRIPSHYLPDFIFGALLLYAILEGTRKSMGWVIFGVVIVGWLYCLAGQWMPNAIRHGGQDIADIIRWSVLEFTGAFGLITQVIATSVAIFVIWAALIQSYGGMELLMRGAFWFSRKVKYMLPQSAIIGSMILGMFTGSAAANAATTGAFTIPMNKRFGIPAAKAAAFEAVASCGGQVMPPIMGTSAFIMASLLGTHYWHIATIGFAPAIIFYLSLFIAVYFISRRYLRSTPLPTHEGPAVDFSAVGQKVSAFELIPITLSLATLMGLFAIFQLGVMIVGFATIMTFLAAQLAYDLIRSRGRLEGLKSFIGGLLRGFRTAVETMAMLGVTAAALGLILGVLSTTGLGLRLSGFMVDTAGGNMILLMVMTILACILFGMAVSTVAAYLLVVIIAAPALNKVGINPYVTHFAIFYAAMLAGFTPPVAGIALITANIARANFWTTCWESIKLATAIFLLPFVFMLNPQILGIKAGAADIVGIAFLSLIGMLGITMGTHLPTQGQGWKQVRRVLYFVLGCIGLFLTNLGPLRYVCLALIVAGMAIEWRWLPHGAGEGSTETTPAVTHQPD